MTKELQDYLLKEEEHAFSGWDFSYLKGRMISDDLPWNYRDFIKQYLHKTDRVLDLGTGGGELFLSFNHPYELSSVTEAYEPNIELCQKTLAPLGITVYPIKQDDLLVNVPTNYYDIVIDHHESFSESEIRRVLKDDGLFVTQQVGADNNQDLATFFDNDHVGLFPKMTLAQTVNRLKENGFEILYQNEAFPKLRFKDLGAIAFFCKIISWEFLNFRVGDNLAKFDMLNDRLLKDGFIVSTEHRFMIVARKKA